jgi:hypothetical protein
MWHCFSVLISVTLVCIAVTLIFEWSTKLIGDAELFEPRMKTNLNFLARKQLTMYIAIFIMMQCSFSFFIYQHLYDSENESLEKHADVVSSSLWRFNKKASLPYLHLEFTDSKGNSFISIDRENIDRTILYIEDDSASIEVIQLLLNHINV